jgi:hypothetical protein
MISTVVCSGMVTKTVFPLGPFFDLIGTLIDSKAWKNIAKQTYGKTATLSLHWKISTGTSKAQKVHGLLSHSLV